MNEFDRIKVRDGMRVIYRNLRLISFASCPFRTGSFDPSQIDQAYRDLDDYLILLSERISMLSLAETMAALRSTQFARDRLGGWDLLLTRARQEFTERLGHDRLDVYFAGFEKSAVNTDMIDN